MRTPRNHRTRTAARIAPAAITAAAARAVEPLEPRRLMAATIYALDGTAPSSVSVYEGIPLHVQALGAATANADLNAKYAWSFGDAGSAHNALEGFNAAHVYAEDPGTTTRTRTVTLTVTTYDSAGTPSTTTDTLTVNVLDNSTFTKIHVDSAAGNDANNGATTGTAVRTINRANQLLTAGNTKVLFKNGQTFNPNGTTFGVGEQNVIFGSYDPALARPVIENPTAAAAGASFLLAQNTARGVVVRDLAFDDPDADVAGLGNVVDVQFNTGPQNVALLDNRLTRVESGINVDGDGTSTTAALPRGLLVQGNTTADGSSLKKYLGYFQGSDVAVLGNTTQNSVDEHIVRLMSDQTNRVLIANNDLTNTGASKETLALRHGRNFYVTRNTIRGARVHIGDTNAGVTTGPRFVVYDSNLTASTLAFTSAVEMDELVDDVVVRNNVFRVTSRDTNWVIGMGGTSGTSNVRILNNTAVNETTGTASFSAAFLRLNAGGLTGLAVRNNLNVVEDTALWTGFNISFGTGADASDLAANRNVWVPKGTGAIHGGSVSYTLTSWNNQATVGDDVTESAASVGLDASYRPAATSTAAGYGRAIAGIFDDYNGLARSTATNAVISAGALEV